MDIDVDIDLDIDLDIDAESNGRSTPPVISGPAGFRRPPRGMIPGAAVVPVS